MGYSSLTFVIGNNFRNLFVHDAVLVRVEVSALQDLLDLVDARLVEHVE